MRSGIAPDNHHGKANKWQDLKLKEKTATKGEIALFF